MKGRFFSLIDWIDGERAGLFCCVRHWCRVTSMCCILQLAGGEIVQDFFFSWHIGMYALRRHYVCVVHQSLAKSVHLFRRISSRGD